MSKKLVLDPKRRITFENRTDGSQFLSITCELAGEIAARFEGDDSDVPKLGHLVYLSLHLTEAGLAHEPHCPALTTPELGKQLAGLAGFAERWMSDSGC